MAETACRSWIYPTYIHRWMSSLVKRGEGRPEACFEKLFWKKKAYFLKMQTVFIVRPKPLPCMFHPRFRVIRNPEYIFQPMHMTFTVLLKKSDSVLIMLLLLCLQRHLIYETRAPLQFGNHGELFVACLVLSCHSHTTFEEYWCSSWCSCS